jgi:hypothetical protein
MSRSDLVIVLLMVIASFILGWGLRWRYDRQRRRIKWNKFFKTK